MKDEPIIERDWITNSGLRAVAIIVVRDGRKKHRCGYVMVPAGHLLHGHSYSNQLPAISAECAASQTLGKKSLMLALTACVGADDGESVRRSLDVVIDVHGGLTYSGGSETYPQPSEGGWWFGFDCAHYKDAEIEPDPRYPNFDECTVRSLEYVAAECESMATQLQAIAGDSK